VHDTLLVGSFERIGDLSRDRKCLVERECFARDSIGERWSLYELQHECLDGPAEAGHYDFKLLEAVDRSDVGMIQRCEELASRLKRTTRSGSSANASGSTV
jgi:hypothetical protein